MCDCVYELVAVIHVGWSVCLMVLVVYEWVHLTGRLVSGAGRSRDLSLSVFDSPVYSETRPEPVHTPARGNAGTPPNTHTYNTPNQRIHKTILDPYSHYLSPESAHTQIAAVSWISQHAPLILTLLSLPMNLKTGTW